MEIPSKDFHFHYFGKSRACLGSIKKEAEFNSGGFSDKLSVLKT